MPLIVTPSQLSRRAELYHQLGALLSAGVALTNSVEMLERKPPSQSFRKPLAQLRLELQQGNSVASSFEHIPDLLPAFDLALLQSGEQSGRLDVTFKLLADYYRDRAQMLRRVISNLMYPAFVFHFAIVLFPFLDFFKTGNFVRFLIQTLGVLLPIYAVIMLGIVACQGSNGERWRAFMERIFNPVPVLGKARRSLALARFAAALEALLNAGVPIIGGLELAARASGSMRLQKKILSWREQLEQGATPAELISNAKEFPEIFASLYSSGEVSGKLDETLRRLHVLFQDEGSHKLNQFSRWAPQLVYFGVIILVAIKVVSFYTNYYGQILDIHFP